MKGITGRQPRLSLAGGVTSVLSAGLAQWLIERGESSLITAGLYGIGIVLFTVSGTYLSYGRPPVVDSAPVRQLWPNRRRLMVAGALFVLFALVFSLMIHRVQFELTTPGASLWPGPILWVVSMILLAAASAVAATPSGGAVWSTTRWPADRNLARLASGLLVIILIALVLARTVALDRVPLGILPDEGDRAGDAISIIRGGITGSMFSSGWYYISNVYFWLLSGVLHAFGIGYAQARFFGAVTSILNSVLVIWMVARHFSLRAGIFAGALTSFLGVSLQFARLTNEAAPTALLWTVSVALLLEAARRSQLWLWTTAGLAGGASIYFYPTGRLWAVLGGGYALYLFVRAASGTRVQILLGGSAMVVGAVVAATPFLINLSHAPAEFTLRAQQTSIFVHENLFRLSYYNPHWNIVQLLWVQVSRCISLFTSLGDAQGFFPSGRPLTWGLLSVLTLLGIGWASLSWRDSRLVVLALWFWIGLSGAVVTVETPNVTRIGSAVPVLAIFPALVLESLVRRAEATTAAARWTVRPSLLTEIAAVVVAVMVWQQGFFYFHDYATINAWAPWNMVGQAVNDQGTDTLVTALGHDSDMVNWGWTRLLAPYVPRGAIEAPGSILPLAVPATTNLAFALGPDQVGFIPYLRELYPGGTIRTYSSATTGVVVMVYRISHRQWSTRQGSVVELPGGRREIVPTLGARPEHLAPSVRVLRWIANWRIPKFDDYGIKLGPGPARLAIDGRMVLTIPAGAVTRTVTIALLRGDHHVVYDAPVSAATGNATFEWREGYPGPGPRQPWSLPAPGSLTPSPNPPGGLAATTSFHPPSLPPQRRLDGTISTCCLGDEVNSGGTPFTTVWTGYLRATRSGTYAMSLVAQGTLGLNIDGHWIVRNLAAPDFNLPARLHIHLRAGWHRVRLRFYVPSGPGGIEWEWQPPGGQLSVVPPSALRPPSGAGTSRPLPARILGPPGWQPTDMPLKVIL